MAYSTRGADTTGRAVLLFVGFIAVLVALYVFVMKTGIGLTEEQKQQLATEQEYQQRLEKVAPVARLVCEGGAVVDGAGYSAGPGPHPIVLFYRKGGEWVADPRSLSKWLPLTIEETQLVACVGEEKESILERCRYTDGSTLIRYGYSQEIRLLEARTGRTVTTKTIEGSPPLSCADTKARSLSAGSSDLRGRRTNYQEYLNWFRSYIE